MIVVLDTSAAVEIVLQRDSAQAIALPDEYINEIELYREAFKLGCTLDHPIYDMLYMVLARRNSAKLLTMDKKLIAAAHKAGVDSGKSYP